jgi:hypothetical protein
MKITILLRRTSPRVVSGREAFLPTGALAIIVLIIKNLVITLTIMVATPVGILAMKIHPIIRVFLVPRVPPGCIPVIRSDDVGRWISVIGIPAILRAKKVIENAMQKPIAVVKDLWRIGPNPRSGVKILGRGRIDLGARRC